ncbi:hypothetical protein BA897_00100 [Spiribacter roseus]|nr:hypothetical protein BA897_00100 [Spiribacter roseus]
MHLDGDELVVRSTVKPVPGARAIRDLKPAIITLAQSAERVGVGESLIRIVAEFGEDLADIRDGQYTGAAIDNAITTIARRRQWGMVSGEVKAGRPP